MTRGKFIVFEGVDFSGKTTQVEMIKSYLNRNNLQDRFLFTKEPGSKITESGPKIREILLMSKDDISPTAEVFLFAADRAIHVQKIKNLLDSGTNIICDRYFYSSIAYQSFAGDFDRDLLYKITAKAIDGIVPDMLFVFNMDIDTYKKRSAVEDSLDRIENRIDLEFFTKISNGYSTMFSEFEEKCPDLLPKEIIFIKASNKPDTIHEVIKKAIVNFL